MGDLALHVIGIRSGVAVVCFLEEEWFMLLTRRTQWATEAKGKSEVAVNDPVMQSSINTTMRRL